MEREASDADLSALKVSGCLVSFLYTFFVDGLDLNVLSNQQDDILRTGIANSSGPSQLVHTPAQLLAANPYNRRHSLPSLSLNTRLIVAQKELSEAFLSAAIPNVPTNIRIHGQRVLKAWETGACLARYDVAFPADAFQPSAIPLLTWAKAGELRPSIYEDFCAAARQFTQVAAMKSKCCWIDDPEQAPGEDDPDPTPLTAQSRRQDGTVVPYQRPYVLVFITVPRGCFRTLFMDDTKGQPAEVRQFLSVLMVDSVEYSYVGDWFATEERVLCKESPRSLYNFSASQWFYINHRYKACIVITADSAMESNRFKVPDRQDTQPYPLAYREVIYDIVEAARIRWYAGSILAALVNRRIQSARAEFDHIQQLDYEHDWPKVSRTLVGLLARAIRTKSLAMRLSEDPVLQTLESDGMSSLYSEVMRRYAFHQREQLLMDKISQISRLYDDILEYARLRRLEALERRPL